LVLDRQVEEEVEALQDVEEHPLELKPLEEVGVVQLVLEEHLLEAFPLEAEVVPYVVQLVQEVDLLVLEAYRPQDVEVHYPCHQKPSSLS
jgi:hypothetical protein